MENYIVVKDFEQVGSVAVKVKLSNCWNVCAMLEEEFTGSNKQVVILNDPKGYGEYEPYDIKENLKEFLNAIL